MMVKKRDKARRDKGRITRRFRVELDMPSDCDLKLFESDNHGIIEGVCIAARCRVHDSYALPLIGTYVYLLDTIGLIPAGLADMRAAIGNSALKGASVFEIDFSSIK